MAPTQAERDRENPRIWAWVDAHPWLGVGRPYRRLDAVHVGLITGKEYRRKHGLQMARHHPRKHKKRHRVLLAKR